MPKVRVKQVYFDKVRDEYPEVNSEFDVEEKRANALVEAGVCELITEEQSDEANEDVEQEEVLVEESATEESVAEETLAEEPVEEPQEAPAEKPKGRRRGTAQ